jgi:DNA-binding CsgD family transcriptional regulator
VEAAVVERTRLERGFARARWAGVAALAAAPLMGYPLAPALGSALALAAANAAVSSANRRASTLRAQRALGAAATAVDGAVVLAAGLGAGHTGATPVLAALAVVMAEAALRYAPLKAAGAAALMVAGLGLVMGVRAALEWEAFSPAAFGALAALTLLAGSVVGLAARELYRANMAPPTAQPEQEPGLDAIPPEALALLTPRERQVLGLIAAGYSNSRIAAALVVEPKTVKNHVNNIYGKLRLNSRYEAIARTLRTRQGAEQDAPGQTQGENP